MTERAPEHQTPPKTDMRVHVTTEHRTVGDALFAAADTAKRAAEAAKRAAPTWDLIDAALKILAICVVTILAAGALLAGGVWLYEEKEHEKRETKDAKDEAVRVGKRRAVLDLIDPGLVPMLCPVPGEIIGRQLVELSQSNARNALGPCIEFGTPCRAYTHDCTPATQLETEAWTRAFRTTPAAQQLAVARRAIVGADPSPQLAFLDAETGQLYTVNRSELSAALRNNPTFVPATPKQMAAWEAAGGE